MNPTELQDKSIVIVGGTSGLGLSATQACLRQGAKLVVVGRDDEFAAEARSNLGKEVRLLLADAADAQTAQEAVSQAVAAYGRLDGLYHVAGGSGRRWGDGPLHEIPDDAWRQTLAVNLDSAFYSNRAAVQQFLKQGSGGSILNLSSVLATSPAPEHFSTHAYATAKAALVGLTKTSAAFYARQKIRFNAIAAGLIETPMSARATTDEKIQHYLKTKQPLRDTGIGLPTDLDAAVSFFLSDASQFVTGQVLAIDGGWEVSEGSA